MQTVRDADDREFLLVKRSEESSRVRDPATGEERYLDNDDLTMVDGESPLETAARGVPEAVRRVLKATHNDRSLGLLLEVVDRGPVSVLVLMDDYDMCESDLHGTLSEFRAAGLVREADAAGRRGYEATETAVSAAAFLRDRDAADDGS